MKARNIAKPSSCQTANLQEFWEKNGKHRNLWGGKKSHGLPRLLKIISKFSKENKTKKNPIHLIGKEAGSKNISFI